MAIRITKTPHIYLTASQLAAYRYEFNKAFAFYSGPRPDFEEWVREQEQRKGTSQGGPHD